ncbi:MAG: isocitrate lyase family protein [Osedax symbiont Rs2]|nr:MAG: isocitrate lyase family protein [Osedax symbiont Rs2]
MKNRLIQLIEEQGIVTAPGVFDGISSTLVEQAGFSAVYASGGAIARSSGVPDIGLLSLTEVVDRIRQIVTATDLPVIADADTGFGELINVKRTVQLFAQTGVSAMHLEDQQFPKRCGHLEGKSLVSKSEMCNKIAVAKKYARDMLVIGRTDAIAVSGMSDAIDRARAYVDSGADMIFVEAPQSLAQIEQIAAQVPGPKLINMFHSGKTPLVNTVDLQQMGYQLIIIPSDLQRAAISGMQKVLAEIYHSGHSGALADEICSFSEREQIVNTAAFLQP